jgi:hypothetical protein
VAIGSDIPLAADEYALCVGAVSHFARVSRARAEEESKIRDVKKLKEAQRARDAVALRCVELLHALFFRANNWELCSQAVAVLSELARDVSAEVRHGSVAALQRVLLAPMMETMAAPSTAPSPPPPPTATGDVQPTSVGQAASQGWALAAALRRVVFPLAADMLRPLGGGKEAANESRVRCCSLLTKFVLQHLPVLSAHPEFPLLWADVLGYLEQYMIFATARTTASDILAEALPELLKNVLLVMTASSLFDQTADKGKELWALTSRAVERTCPEVVQEIGTRIQPKPTPPPAVAAALAPTAPPQPQPQPPQPNSMSS